MESCELYIRNLVYQDQSWLDDPDFLMELIYNNLNEIKDFYFLSLNLNMAQAYNVNLKSSNYDSMIMYIKGIKYRKQEFLTLENVKKLENEIKKQLNYIEYLYFGELEFRTSNTYLDSNLGLVEPTVFIKHNRAPLVLES